MPWVKITDKLHENDKIVESSGDAVKLWLLALSWSNDKLTDGHIPLSRPVRLMEMRKSKDVVSELVSRRLWHQAAHPCGSCLAQRKAKGVTDPVPSSGYLIHHYFDFQRPAWVIKSDRLKRSEAGQAGADARWGDGKSHGKPDGKVDGSLHGSMLGKPDSKSHAIEAANDGKLDGKLDAPVPPYPVPPSSGSKDPVTPEDPFAPETPEDGSLKRSEVRREGVRHVRTAAETIVAIAQRRALS